MRGRRPAAQSASKRSHASSTQPRQLPRRGRVARRVVAAHGSTSSAQSSRIRLSLRSTVVTTQPSLRGDLGVGVALHLPHGHPPQRLVPQAVQEPGALLGHLRRQLGGRLGAEDGLDVRALQVGQGQHPAAAAGGAALVLGEVDGLAHRQDEEQLPEVVAVLEPGELARLGAAAEAVEGAQRHVLLVGGDARGRARSRARASATRRRK